MKTPFYVILLLLSHRGLTYAQQDKSPVALESADTTNYPPFTYIEKMPSFPGGQIEMYKFIYGNLKYPTVAKRHNITGQSIIQFVVSKEGEITKAKVIKYVGHGCDEEALRIVNSMPRWLPGEHNGRATDVTFTLPIKFSLSDK